jgi:spermidine synthase
LKTKKTYDLIIIDIFEDTKMPNFVYEKFFINRIGDLLNNRGFILFNTMLLDEKQDQRNRDYIKNFDNKSFTTYSIPRVERHNEIIIVQKNILQ